MKQEFIDFLNELMKAAPHVEMTPNVKAYIDALMEKGEEKPVLTDNGKLILRYMQENSDKTLFKAREIAEGLFISSRTVSGAMRKLVTDGYVEKVATDPVIYSITEQGKTVEIN